MDIKTWQEKIIEVLKDISDEEFQRESWLGRSDKISSPEELYCNLFDDFIFKDFIEEQKSLFSSAQLGWGQELVKKMEAFKETIFSYPDPQEIIDDERWIEIRQLADRLKATFEA
ncbi:hypothetical protein [Phormidium tenue]|nr:hypothetical protein [Phormidium tenue]MBD2233004.1 hypothetical protein [Phormidium tenue FACHB-1052]